MRVRRIDKNGDWTFGQGLHNYAKDNEAVAQNVPTRLRSFRNDWFLDVMANIDWFTILSRRDNEATILAEVRRVCKATYGVQAVLSVSLNDISGKSEQTREANITVSLKTIFGETIHETVGVSYGF